MTKDVYEEIFLKEKVVFWNIDDLFKRIKDIRLGYLSLEKGVQRVYKWYFFCELSNVAKADDLKSNLWSYITSDDENSNYAYDNICASYLDFCIRRNNLFKTKN